MAALKFEYGTPFRISIGGRYLTVTEITGEGSNEEYAKGGSPLDYTKLGLPNNKVDCIFAALPLIDKKVGEATKGGVVAIGAELLQIVTTSTATKLPLLEMTDKEKVKEYKAIIVAIGS